MKSKFWWVWGPSSWKDRPAGNCNKEDCRRNRFGIGKAKADLSVRCLWNLHRKVTRKQRDTEVWLSWKRMGLERTDFEIIRDKTVFILIDPTP